MCPGVPILPPHNIETDFFFDTSEFINSKKWGKEFAS
jgi:hypothetical protein